MALATYADLQAAIANYLARPGDTLVSGPAPDFVSLAESRIAYGSSGQWPCRPLRIRAMEKTALLMTAPAVNALSVAGSANVITCVAGLTSLTFPTAIAFTAALSNTAAATLNADGLGAVAVKKGVPQADLEAGDLVAGASYTVYYDGTVWNLVPTGAVPLPAGYLQMRSIFIQGSPETQLSNETPETFNGSALSLGSGKPQSYVLEGDAIRFGPPPDAIYAVQMGYYKKFGALSSAANWLMTYKPDVYLYGSLLEAAIYFGNDEDMAKFFGLYCAATEGLQSQDMADRYSGSVLQMRPAMLGA